MSEHTPGPWGYTDEEPREVRLKRAHWAVGALDSREGVALVFRGEANAKLIAAAPELLEALRPFAKFACDTPCDCHNCRARAAIAKAQGES